MAFGTDTPYPVFQSTGRPQLISLAAARANPNIVYHSVKGVDRAPVCPQAAATSTATTTKQRKIRHAAPKPAATFAPRFQPPIGMTLIPLRLANVRNDIKYRKEGFELLEMREHRRHIQAVREDPF